MARGNRVVFREKRAPEKEITKEEFWKTYEESAFNEASSWRTSHVEKQWMINMAFYRGWHNLKYDVTNDKIIWDRGDNQKFYVNMVFTTIRAVRNSVLKYQPVWDVDTKPYAKADPEEMKTLGEYISAKFADLKMDHKVKEALTYGMIYGLGVFQYGYDTQLNEGQGGIFIDNLDPFDTYIDPVATSMEDARWVIKVVRRPLEVVKSNKIYQNTEELGADNKLSESEYKERLFSKVENNTDSKTVLLHEMWVKNNEDGKIWVVTTCNKKVLRAEPTEFKRLPFVLYQPDINPNEIYSEGWVKNLIPLNRALNMLERNILEFNNIFAKGKYLMDKGAKVKSVTNENGQIIKVSRGYRFEQMDMKPMSSSPFNQIQNMLRYIQDVGAAHEAVLGRAPTGVEAGVAFEQLVANAYINFADLTDNLIITLEELGQAILEMGYEYQDVTEDFKAPMAGGGEITKEVKSSKGMEMMDMERMKEEGVVLIPKNPKIKVSISSGVAFTKGGKTDVMFRLRANEDVDRRTMLETLGLDADVIEKRLAEELQTGVSINQGIEQEAGIPGDLSMLDISQLSDAAQALISDLQSQGLQLSQEFINDPNLIEQLAAGQLPYHVMPEGIVMPGDGMAPQGQPQMQPQGQEQMMTQ